MHSRNGSYIQITPTRAPTHNSEIDLHQYIRVMVRFTNQIYKTHWSPHLRTGISPHKKPLCFATRTQNHNASTLNEQTANNPSRDHQHSSLSAKCPASAVLLSQPSPARTPAETQQRFPPTGRVSEVRFFFPNLLRLSSSTPLSYM